MLADFDIQGPDKSLMLTENEVPLKISSDLAKSAVSWRSPIMDIIF